MSPKEHETALQRALMAWIIIGLAFLLLPGTFLGVWNLIAISGQRTVTPEWIQAHGHAQIFGWIGSFILGIGFYSLPKMTGIGRFAVSRAWASWAMWTCGVLLRWLTNIYGWQWRVALPLSAALELTAFAVFFMTVRGHRSSSSKRPETGVIVVASSTMGFLSNLCVNLAIAIRSAVSGSSPAIPHAIDQRILPLFTWGFPVIAIWGFSSRWLPVFLGLREPRGRVLLAAVGLIVGSLAASFSGLFLPAAILSMAGAVLAVYAIRIFDRSERPPKTAGVHRTFPVFVRLSYVWLLIAAALGVFAAEWDRAGGLWGASRHALTVGFMSGMVFAIGQRVLPAFCGMRVLFSPRLMFASLAALECGSFLRVLSEVCAYEGYAPSLWPLLPVSAVIELAAVTLFACNLMVTLFQEPPHLRVIRPVRAAVPVAV